MVFILLIVVAVAAFGISQWAAGRHMAMMNKGARVTAPTAHTGEEIARLFLATECVSDVQIVEHDSVVSDYFDPVRRRLFLRKEVAQGTTLAAWAVALHEAAHALQTGAEGLGELKWRQSCIRLCRYLPVFSALVLVGLMLGRVLVPRNAILVFVMLFGLLVMLNLGTVPVEFAANRRAREFLERHLNKHPQAVERLNDLLFAMAIREVGDALRSPRYFFLSALPGAGKSRPG
ncbi:MAG: zinc metallopeptidase [Verrucomicrobiaceae bacterium]|jgi:Zn-dependent membrane protease YugP|nr:zinc metallopeptidase [Verrucomicrobiaceae bacterium]